MKLTKKEFIETSDVHEYITYGFNKKGRGYKVYAGYKDGFGYCTYVGARNVTKKVIVNVAYDIFVNLLTVEEASIKYGIEIDRYFYTLDDSKRCKISLTY